MMHNTLTSDTIFSKILFSHLLLLNRINWTLDFETESFVDLKKNILSFIRPKANNSHYYIEKKMNKCDRNCNTTEDLFGRIWVQNKWKK